MYAQYQRAADIQNCQKKLRFVTSALAHEQRKRIEYEELTPMYIYDCWQCGGWHLTHIDPWQPFVRAWNDFIAGRGDYRSRRQHRTLRTAARQAGEGKP